jgi:hypothetical protein
MNILKIFVFIVAITILSACNTLIKSDLKNIEGNWKPREWKNMKPLISEMQILKRDNFYLIAVNYYDNEDIMFLIGKREKDHLIITSSPMIGYGRTEEGNKRLLEHPSAMYFDKKLSCVFFLNTVFEYSTDNLFNLIVNVDGDQNKQQLKYK